MLKDNEQEIVENMKRDAYNIVEFMLLPGDYYIQNQDTWTVENWENNPAAR